VSDRTWIKSGEATPDRACTVRVLVDWRDPVKVFEVDAEWVVSPHATRYGGYFSFFLFGDRFERPLGEVLAWRYLDGEEQAK
jgi:hypothetical protein